MEANNMKAMRKALERTDLFLSALGKWLKVNDEGQEYALAAGVIHTLVEHALAAPARNCDVGTAEEQNNRHGLWCAKHDVNGDMEADCANNACSQCILKWSQMPYKEGEH